MLVQTPPRQAGILQACTRRSVFIFISVILDQRAIPVSHTHPSAVVHDAVPMGVFASSRSCLGQVLVHLPLLSASNPVWSLRHSGKCGLGLCPLLCPAHCSWVTEVCVHWGTQTIGKANWEMLPNFLKSCPETKLNIAELQQVCNAEFAAQGK